MRTHKDQNVQTDVNLPAAKCTAASTYNTMFQFTLSTFDWTASNPYFICSEAGQCCTTQ